MLNKDSQLVLVIYKLTGLWVGLPHFCCVRKPAMDGKSRRIWGLRKRHVLCLEETRGVARLISALLQNFCHKKQES
jgi:hypothetical protein